MANPIEQRVQIETGDSEANLRDVGQAAADADTAVKDLTGTKVDVDTREAEIDVGRVARELEDVDDQIRKLRDRKLEIKAELDARGFDTGIKKIDDERPGRRIGEQFVQDIGGSFGGTAWSQAAADMVAAFETLGETLGDTVGGRVVNRMTAVLIPALGIGGALAGAVGGFWTMFVTNAGRAADEARQEVEDLASQILELGSRSALFDKLRTDWLEEIPGTKGKRVVDFLTTLGLTFEDVWDMLNGKANPAFEKYNQILAGWQAIPIDDRDADTVARYAAKWGLTTDQLYAAVGATSAINAELERTQSMLTKAITDSQKLSSIFGIQPATGNGNEPTPASGVQIGAVNNYYPPSTDGRAVTSGLQEYYRRNGRG